MMSDKDEKHTWYNSDKLHSWYSIERMAFYDKSSVVPVYSIFQEFAKQLNGRLTINSYSDNLDHHAAAQESIYRLYIEHSGETICVEYAMGAQHVAACYVEIETLKQIPEFEITTRSPFATLFLGKKNRVQVKCENTNLRIFLKENQHLISLNALSAKTGFEPYFFGENSDLSYLIRTEYHLRFPQRTQEIVDLLNFNASLIDFIHNFN